MIFAHPLLNEVFEVILFSFQKISNFVLCTSFWYLDDRGLRLKIKHENWLSSIQDKRSTPSSYLRVISTDKEGYCHWHDCLDCISSSRHQKPSKIGADVKRILTSVTGSNRFDPCPSGEMNIVSIRTAEKAPSTELSAHLSPLEHSHHQVLPDIHLLLI